MATRRLIIASLFTALLLTPALNAQVGTGLLDLNSAGEKDLGALPGMTPAAVKALIDRRPFGSITDANAFLLAQKLTPEQTAAIYRKAFVHVNLNTATRDEILLIPGAGNRMAREFAEYRPWRTWGQFDKEISKYVGQAETDRLKQYVFIPVNLNTATEWDPLESTCRHASLSIL